MSKFQMGIREDHFFQVQYTEDGPYDVMVESFSIAAGSPEGRNWAYAAVNERDRAEVESVLAKLLAAGNNPDTHPDEWIEVDPTYGSEAWDSEAEYNLACFEADCFNEPRPVW